MRSFLFLCIILLFPAALPAQPPPPSRFELRFFGRFGQQVKLNDRYYKIVFRTMSGEVIGRNQIRATPTGATIITMERERQIHIDFISGLDTMGIETHFSIDSIPFLKGNFIIPSAYDMLFSMTAYHPVKIKDQDWDRFRVSADQKKTAPRSLKENRYGFWADRKKQIRLEGIELSGILYNPEYSPDLYGWDLMNVFVSHDKGQNWERIIEVQLPYTLTGISFKDQHTLIYTKVNEYGRPAKAEAYVSKNNGASWKPEPDYTKAGFYFVAFDKKGNGVAFSLEGFRTTRYHTSSDGGKTWTKGIISREYLYPRSVVIWEKGHIVLRSVNNLVVSEDGGESWRQEPFNYSYLGTYPIMSQTPDIEDDAHDIEKFDAVTGKTTKLLTVKRSWYLGIAATQKAWCISSRFILISTDQGKHWNYYCNWVGSNVLAIIDDRYILTEWNVCDIEEIEVR